MTDIELVIKIPEEEYKLCKKYKGHLGDHRIISDAIAKGIPLLRGHERLIDESKGRNMTEKDAVEIALEASALDGWIDAVADGGITPPRITLSVDAEDFGCGFNVTVKYKYPPESHPNSDVTYHLSKPEKVYSSTYVLTDDHRIYRIGCDKLFRQADVFPDLVSDSILDFFSRNNLKEVEE